MNFIIGEIVKAQGIKGEVKVKPMTDDLARFGCLKTVSVDGCPFKLRNATARGGFVYLSFEGVNSRNDAEVLVGRKILIDRSQAKKTEEGEFFIVDLVQTFIYPTIRASAFLNILIISVQPTYLPLWVKKPYVFRF